MITFDKVRVEFGDFVALPEFTLDIAEGEFFTFLGPSGCGKTTALRALAGFNTPTSGRIMIDGKDVTKLASDKRQIGMVFQNYALFPSLSVYENIAFGLRVKKAKEAEVEARVREVAAQVDLNDAQLSKGIAEMSGGQQQRVAIARALVMKPRIMLLDEPLSNLDAKLRHQLRGQLKQLQTEFGITTVYVTHDQDEALALSDRIAVLNKGHIEQVGTPQEVYNASATEFVCTFIGDANRFTPESSAIIRRDTGADLDPTLPSYVRIEKIDLLAAPEQAAGRALTDGVVLSKAYHGLHYNYGVRLGHSVINAILPEKGRSARQFEIGDRVYIAFDREAIMQYPGGPAVQGVAS